MISLVYSASLRAPVKFASPECSNLFCVRTVACLALDGAVFVAVAAAPCGLLFASVALVHLSDAVPAHSDLIVVVASLFDAAAAAVSGPALAVDVAVVNVVCAFAAADAAASAASVAVVASAVAVAE